MTDPLRFAFQGVRVILLACDVLMALPILQIASERTTHEAALQS